MLKKNKEKKIRKERRLFIGRPARFEKKTATTEKSYLNPLTPTAKSGIMNTMKERL